MTRRPRVDEVTGHHSAHGDPPLGPGDPDWLWSAGDNNNTNAVHTLLPTAQQLQHACKCFPHFPPGGGREFLIPDPNPAAKPLFQVPTGSLRTHVIKAQWFYKTFLWQQLLRDSKLP